MRECDNLLVKAKGGANPFQSMMDPSSMSEGMMKNMSFIVPQMLMMGFINFFFSGFIVGTLNNHLLKSF